MKYSIATLISVITVNCVLVNGYNWYGVPKTAAPGSVMAPVLCLKSALDLRQETLTYQIGGKEASGHILTPVNPMKNGKPIIKSPFKTLKDGTQVPYCFQFQVTVPSSVKAGKSIKLVVKRARKYIWAKKYTSPSFKVTATGAAPPTSTWQKFKSAVVGTHQTLKQKITDKYGDQYNNLAGKVGLQSKKNSNQGGYPQQQQQQANQGYASQNQFYSQPQANQGYAPQNQFYSQPQANQGYASQNQFAQTFQGQYNAPAMSQETPLTSNNMADKFSSQKPHVEITGDEDQIYPPKN